ncbi:hypothetical protein [Streptomyces achromogenes]|uniref:hypothetical protein n=1 Tax=Streptomyces achromogenes TaxID=67255 RepID=UPI0036F91941
MARTREATSHEQRLSGVRRIAHHRRWTEGQPTRLRHHAVDGPRGKGGSRSTTGRLIPWNLFTDPELARVGLTEEQARATGRDIRVAKPPVKAIPRARTMRETRGLWKVVVDRDTEEILGVALLGPDSSEVLTVVQTAMWAGLPFTALRDGLIAHPTMAEGLNALFTSWVD